MKRSVVPWFLLVSLFTLGWCLQPQPALAADETYTHKSPEFTLTVPDWTVVKSKNPASVLRRAADPYEVTSIDVVVTDLAEGKTLKDLPKDLIDYLKKEFQAANNRILYEKEIQLSDGTTAYECEVRWNHPAILLFTYQLGVIKDKKVITVSVTTDSKVTDDLKKYPLSLKFK